MWKLLCRRICRIHFVTASYDKDLQAHCQRSRTQSTSHHWPSRYTQFLGLNRSLLTLLQFVTLDDIADVYYPLVLERPYLCAFFFPILIFISIGLMNLVTAALVENETWFMTFMTWNLVWFRFPKNYSLHTRLKIHDVCQPFSFLVFCLHRYHLCLLSCLYQRCRRGCGCCGGAGAGCCGAAAGVIVIVIVVVFVALHGLSRGNANSCNWSGRRAAKVEEKGERSTPLSWCNEVWRVFKVPVVLEISQMGSRCSRLMQEKRSGSCGMYQLVFPLDQTHKAGLETHGPGTAILDRNLSSTWCG